MAGSAVQGRIEAGQGRRTGGEAEPSTGPKVELIRWFETPHDQSVAAARTCYSSRVVYPGEVSRDERARSKRDALARSIFRAGHHTTIQHPSFGFVLQRVSRQLLWSFLHAHPFYNSEQVSQRYVPVKPGSVHTPVLAPAALEIYETATRRQHEAYHDLEDLLLGETRARYFEIYPGRRREPERWHKAIEKRVLEVARYVLPIATHAHLYHTISGVTLYRYARLQDAFDVPAEQRQVVQGMLEAVRRVDPAFLRNLEDPLPLEQTPEHVLLVDLYGRADGVGAAEGFLETFDQELQGRRARLVDWKVNAESTLARAVREVFGATPRKLSDAEAIARALDPAKNPSLTGALNVTMQQKITRALHHAHYTFQKKLSHTADSQAQRHRMTPGSRPILATHYVPGQPDYILPDLVRAVPAARARFEQAMTETWEAIDRLLDRGVAAADALYLLPNAFPIRFQESGDLLNLRHRWTLRLCYLAQDEIFHASRDEVTDLARVHPQIARHMMAPCAHRKRAGVRPFCPEGARFCGVPVWDLPVKRYDRRL